MNGDVGPDVTAELATEVAASLRPALWTRRDPVATHARLRWIDDVRTILDRALTLGSLKGAIYRSRNDGRIDVELALEVLDVKTDCRCGCAEVLRSLAYPDRHPDGTLVAEPPTGQLPAVPAQAWRDPTGPLAIVVPGDELATRRTRRG